MSFCAKRLTIQSEHLTKNQSGLKLNLYAKGSKQASTMNERFTLKLFSLLGMSHEHTPYSKMTAIKVFVFL